MASSWTEQSRNIEAIEKYIGEQVPPKTKEAIAVRDEFLRWLSAVSDWDRNMETGTYDKVRNFKLRYNRANATSPVEKAAVEEQAIRGLSSEQLEGQADRRLSDGTYVPAASTKDQIIKVIVGVGILTAAAVMLKKKL